MAYKRSVIVEQAQAWIGCKESDGSHQQIIDIYNAHSPLARGYTVQYTDAWCATFVSAVAIKCGYTDIMPTECGCQEMIALYQNLGCWEEDDSYTPSAGDVIFYDWDDSGSGDCTGGADHVGIVEKVSGSKITVIEGNYSNSVKRRTMAVNGQYIRGYGLPKYDSESSGTTSSGTTDYTVVKGDTLSAIALKYGTTVDAILAANEGRYAKMTRSYIETGWVLAIPTSASEGSGTGSTSAPSDEVEDAMGFDSSLAGAYTVADALNLRSGAGTSKKILAVMPKGATVRNYGYYTDVDGTRWLYVKYGSQTGFASATWLTK